MGQLSCFFKIQITVNLASWMIRSITVYEPSYSNQLSILHVLCCGPLVFFCVPFNLSLPLSFPAYNVHNLFWYLDHLHFIWSWQLLHIDNWSWIELFHTAASMIEFCQESLLNLALQSNLTSSLEFPSLALACCTHWVRLLTCDQELDFVPSGILLFPLFCSFTNASWILPSLYVWFCQAIHISTCPLIHAGMGAFLPESQIPDILALALFL